MTKLDDLRALAGRGDRAGQLGFNIQANEIVHLMQSDTGVEIMARAYARKYEQVTTRDLQRLSVEEALASLTAHPEAAMRAAINALIEASDV